MDLSYLELEGQGRGIIMEVTRLLLLRLFYYTANVSGHFMVGLRFERWETMDKYHIVTIAQFA